MPGEPWHVARPHCSVLQPQGITLARIDGPTTDDVTMRESGECEITPSTDVKYPQGSITSMRNQWLLIGVDPRRAPGDGVRALRGMAAARLRFIPRDRDGSAWGHSPTPPHRGVQGP